MLKKDNIYVYVCEKIKLIQKNARNQEKKYRKNILFKIRILYLYWMNGAKDVRCDK